MTRNEPIKKGRVVQHGKGVGTVDEGMVEQRAREIALINGRAQSQINEADYAQARRELVGADVSAPSTELGAGAGETAPWVNPGSAGNRPESQEVDDEQSVPEQLMNEGVEEAQHDQMVEGTRDSIRRDTR